MESHPWYQNSVRARITTKRLHPRPTILAMFFKRYHRTFIYALLKPLADLWVRDAIFRAVDHSPSIDGIYFVKRHTSAQTSPDLYLFSARAPCGRNVMSIY